MRRMGILKKGRTTPMSLDVAFYLEQLSKQALVDVFVDAMSAMEGCATDALDLASIRGFVEPRLRVRGDRSPRTPR